MILRLTSRLARTPARCAAGLGLLLSWGHAAMALEATISAQYHAAASGRFENTTPPALFCTIWPAECQGMTAVGVPITFTKRTIKNDSNVRNQYYVQVPGARQVEVYHERTGEAHSLNFEITGISQRVQGSDDLQGNPTYNRYLNTGCTYKRTFGSVLPPYPVTYLWAVNNPRSPAVCLSNSHNKPTGYTQVTQASAMGIAYNLEMPAPYRMKPGIYSGSVTFSVGPGGDFDFGDGVTELSGNTLTLNFVLDVQHAFIFDFPPGSDRAVLEPPGGWQSWLGGRGVPQRLERDLPFRLWSSGPFKVYKLCQRYLGTGCAISNDQNHAVPVDISLSLPGGIQHKGGPVQRLELPSGRSDALAFDSVTPVLNRPGQLHFTVGSQGIKDMLGHPGSRYEGLVTVVFDSEL